MTLSSHQSSNSKSIEWLTPPELLYSLGTFDLDPCSPIKRPWDTAKKHYTVKDDGLSQDWGSGRVWLNPPFGRQSVKWMERMAQHNNGIALLAARTETKMFFEFVWPIASGILFVEGRPHFHYQNGKRAPFNSGAPICLISYGPSNYGFLERSNLGKCICFDNKYTIR